MKVLKYRVRYGQNGYNLYQFIEEASMMPLLNQLHLGYTAVLHHANTLIPLMHNTNISKEKLKEVKRAVKGLAEYTDIIALTKKYPDNCGILQALDEWAWSVESFVLDNGPANAIKHSYKAAYKLIDQEKSK